MKNIKLYVTTAMMVSVLLLASCQEKSDAIPDNVQKVIKMNEEFNPTAWHYDDAVRIMNEAVHPAYGIEDQSKLDLIIERKDVDDYALYAYAYILKQYDVAHEFGLTEAQAQTESAKLFLSLAQKGHPQASAMLAQSYVDEEGQKLLLKILGMTQIELLDKRIEWFKAAISGGERLYADYADTLIFGLAKEQALETLLPNSLLLAEGRTIPVQAIDAYRVCATQGRSEYCGARMAEAYYWGLGVAQDDVLAHAWAQLVLARTSANYMSVYSTTKIAIEIEEKTRRALNADTLKLSAAVYENLLKEIPVNQEGLDGSNDYAHVWAQGRDTHSLIRLD